MIAVIIVGCIAAYTLIGGIVYRVSERIGEENRNWDNNMSHEMAGTFWPFVGVALLFYWIFATIGGAGAMFVDWFAGEKKSKYR